MTGKSYGKHFEEKLDSDGIHARDEKPEGITFYRCVFSLPASYIPWSTTYHRTGDNAGNPYLFSNM
jgi:hypothetical protein